MMRWSLAAPLCALLTGCAVTCGCPPGTPSTAAAPPPATVAGSGTSAVPVAWSPIHLVDATGGYVGQYVGKAPGTPAAAMVRLQQDLVATVYIDGPRDQLRPRRGMVLSARPDCGPPYYVERQDEWQSAYPGAVLAEVRTVQGRRLAFATRGRWSELPADARLWVVGTCEPTWGYRRAVAPVEQVVDLADRLQEPFSLR